MPRGEFSGWLKGRELPRLTPHTTIEHKAFRALIARVRQDDLAVAREEHELGVFALAVPLRNMQGRTVAALNVVAAPERFDAPSFQKDLMPLLQDAARELRSLL